MPKVDHLTSLQQQGPHAHPREAPVLEIEEDMIEAKARRVLHAEMSKRLEKGPMEEVMFKDDEEAARRVLQLEKRLREIAKIGVIKLSEEVRDARTRCGEGSRVLGSEGVVGIAKKSMMSRAYGP